MDYTARAEQAINRQLPVPCGNGCPYICCTPIITGFFIPRELITESHNYHQAKDYINNLIDTTINSQKTSEGQIIFTFKGMFLTEIDTENEFLPDKIIEDMILAKTGKDLPSAKLKQYLNQVKTRFRELNLGLILLFDCPKYSSQTKGCTIYHSRPQLCRDYTCEQFTENISSSELTRRMTLKAEQRKLVLDNYQRDLSSASKIFRAKSNI